MSMPRNASDYSARDTEAVRRVLIELGQVLGTWREKFVIVGGAVPWLLLESAEPEHIGTLDIDIALDPTALEDDEYADLIEALETKGYERSTGDLKAFQLRRYVTVDSGPPIAVIVDFLIPKGLRPKSRSSIRVPHFRAIDADGASIALEHSAMKHLEGRMVDGRQNAVDIRVVGIPAFLVMKGHALASRAKEKDAYDIYFCVRNYPGGPEALAIACADLLSDEGSVTGFAKIRQKFRRENDYGPSTVRMFLAQSSALGGMTTDQVETDAFMQVDAFLNALAIGL